MLIITRPLGKVTLCFLMVFLLISCSDDESPKTHPNDLSALSHEYLTDWVKELLEVSKNSPGFTPPIVSRAFAYSSITLYEALRFGFPGYRSLSGQLTGLQNVPEPDPDLNYDWILVANAAMKEVVKELYSVMPVDQESQIEELIFKWNAARSLESDPVTNQNSEVYGKALAVHLIDWMKEDGGHKAHNRNFPSSYIPPEGPGLWKPTDSSNALLPYWGANRTFLLNIVSNSRPADPPEFSTATDSEFYQAALEIYEISQVLTQEEKDIAFYWTDDPFATYTPPGHSTYIFLSLAISDNLSLAQATEAFLLLSIAQSDAFVSCWHWKFYFNLVRPVTYIREHIDPNWSPVIITPPFPEYTSGHSTQSASSSVILTHVFGEDYSFVDRTHETLQLGKANRTFNSFYEMAEEAGMSRIYGGIHYQFGNIEGRIEGYKIGHEVLKMQLKSN